jgi:hypothetical protein
VNTWSSSPERGASSFAATSWLADCGARGHRAGRDGHSWPSLWISARHTLSTIRSTSRAGSGGRRYRVREVAFDPWRASTIATVLEREGVMCTAFPQTARMIPASAALHRAVVERRLCVPDSPTLAQHAANAVARQSRRGWRLDRPSRQAGLNIDAVIALAMAVDAVENQGQPVERLGWL